MTGLFFLLAMLALLVTSVCGIWLLVLSFRVSVLWGLAVFFIPFAVVVFAIKFWDQCKKPFIGHLGGSVAAVVFIMLAVASGVGGQIAEANQQAALTDAAPFSTAVPDVSIDSSGTSVAPSPRPSPRPRRVAPRRPRTPSRAKLTFDNASDFVGRLIKITAHDGRVLKGYLIDARSDTLVLERDLTSGVFSFEVTSNDVKSMELIR